MRGVQRSICLTRSVFVRPLTTSSTKPTLITTNNVVKSPLPPVEVPNLTIEEFLFEKFDRWHDKTAVLCAQTGRFYTFGQYKKLSENLAQALRNKFKFQKGDTIAVVLPNIPEYVTIYLATFRAGITLTTISPTYTPDEIARQMSDCSAKAIFTLAQTYKTAQNAINKLETNKHIPIFTIKHEQSDTTPEGTINFQELCEYNGPQTKIDRPSPTDIAILPYSSGTSGLPKGVQLTHRNIVSDVVQIQQDSLRITHETTNSHQDVTSLISPLYHCYGMIPILFNSFSQGCKSVILPKYTPNTFLDLFEKNQINYTFLVPPLILMLINNENAKRHHMRALRHVVSAAAPLAASDIKMFKEKFGENIKVIQYYGLTETGPVTHAQRLDKEIIPGSVGCNLPLVETRIVSVEDDKTNLGPNETGHLLIRGPNVMPGYHKNPKATAEAIDEDGWFKSGDVGYYDENGEFFITDRIKELIKVKGFQVAPAELEALIREHPDVDDVAVTSSEHPQLGEAPRAFVVPRQGSNLQEDHVHHHVKQKAAKHKQLAGGVVFVKEIPKNPSGKILRRMLKNM